MLGGSVGGSASEALRTSRAAFTMMRGFCLALALIVPVSGVAVSPGLVDATQCQGKLKVQCVGDHGPHGSLKECEACALAHLQEDNCTKREAMVFCSGRPGPTPGPVADKCIVQLKKLCGDTEKDRPKCEECLEQNAKTDGCTLKEEFAFCDAGGDPKPEPIVDECLADLKAHCEDRRANATDCDHCLERVDHALKAHCTRQDELKFCHGGEKPKPISNRCVALLETDCKKFVGAYDGGACYNCTQKALKTEPDVACTPEEEFNFCEYGPIDHPPMCIEELQKLCGKPWGKQHANRTECTDCVVAHEKGGTWTKVKCTRAEVQKFC